MVIQRLPRKPRMLALGMNRQSILIKDSPFNGYFSILHIHKNVAISILQAGHSRINACGVEGLPSTSKQEKEG